MTNSFRKTVGDAMRLGFPVRDALRVATRLVGDEQKRDAGERFSSSGATAEAHGWRSKNPSTVTPFKNEEGKREHVSGPSFHAHPDHPGHSVVTYAGKEGRWDHEKGRELINKGYGGKSLHEHLTKFFGK